MGQKRGRGRAKAAEPDPQAIAKESAPEPAPDAALSESELARIRLRQRWELASVLNFFSVFKEKVGADSKITAEEIETGLITPNGDLAQIHISLLKGIPPTSKISRENDAWVTLVCKKLANWWPWVAEGEIPLEADHGEEIKRYKELDPTTRLLILKALCELRALQDDIMKYIADGLKNGTPIGNFRKEKIGGDNNGIIYWYDGDPVVGYRLYKEITVTEIKQKSKGKARQTQLVVEPQWETVATNLEEFCEISDNLLSSRNKSEAAVGEIVKTDIIPVLENLQKKKERALKRQQTQAMLLEGFVYSNGRQTRERKPVKYTFDEYDRAIDEAIHVSKKSKTTASVKNTDKVGKQVVNEDTVKDYDKENSNPGEDHRSQAEVGYNEGVTDNGKTEGIMSDHNNDCNNYDEKNEGHDDNNNDEKNNDCNVSDNDEEEDYRDGNNQEDDDDDRDSSNYDEKDDDRDGSNYEEDEGGDDDGNSSASDDNDRNSSASDENDSTYSVGDSDKKGLSRSARVKKDAKANKVVNSRRSRNRSNGEGKGHGEAKKRLRQRPTRNIDYNDESDSESEDDFVSSDDED